MPTVYKIHPAIGIARVGNSGDFFIGPDRLRERPSPAGGFKDPQGKVKRQAARFHIFAHHDDGTTQEITSAEADITWTVHVANKKASYPTRGNPPSADLNIDPGPRTINGPNQSQVFNNGFIRFRGPNGVIRQANVPLGEIRSDNENHLLFLGGSGTSGSPFGNGISGFWANTGWYDDIADGPIEATIKIRATGETPAVVGAWVISAPPKFAPHQDSVTTLYDRVLQAMVSAGRVPAPNATSYTNDVFPILQRARDMAWVIGTGGAHKWVDPVTDDAKRQAIYSRLKPPPGNMPNLNSQDGDSALTQVQHDHMQRWKDGAYNNDWGGVPAAEANISAAGLDRAALEACVGGAFYPGIEAGGKPPGGGIPERAILDPAHYSDAFRIDHAVVKPGDISAGMALPWQADFNACDDHWWPVPRPNDVLPQGGTTTMAWDRGIGSAQDMVDRWYTLGFVVDDNGKKVETERSGAPFIRLLTPQLNFADVAAGPIGMVREQPLAISFDVSSPTSALTLEYAPGGAPSHPQLVANNTSVTVGPTGDNMATAQLWVIYRTGNAPSSIPTQTVTVREPVSGQTWTVRIDGNTVPRKTAAVALVLDRSGSMSDDRGDGQTKHQSVQQAAEIFVDVMLEGDGVGLVRYDDDAQEISPVVELGQGGLSDISRSHIIDLIRGNSFDPAGGTSIGDGIDVGTQSLNAASNFDLKSLAVLTDGIENTPQFINDVSADISATTYAIGFGTPQNTSAVALQTISGNNGGYLLVTGAIGTDNRFALQKYFLQILSGVSNAEIVLDPDGDISIGEVQTIPFTISDADAGMDVILVTPYANKIDFRLQAPSGKLIEPWLAQSEPAMRYISGTGVAYYRVALPAQLEPGRFDQAGTWNALISIGSPRFERSANSPDGIDHEIMQGINSRSMAVAATPTRDIRLMSESERRFAVAAEAAADATNGSAGRASARSSDQTHARIPFSLIVHAYSSLSLRAEVLQDDFEPGAKVRVLASLTQSGLPMREDARVWMDVTGPNGFKDRVGLQRTDRSYEAAFGTDSSGVYSLRIQATGRTARGLPFTREKTLTVPVWRGGNKPPPIIGEGGKGRFLSHDDAPNAAADLITCLLESGAISDDLLKKLRKAGVDMVVVRKCFAQARQRRAPSKPLR